MSRYARKAEWINWLSEIPHCQLALAVDAIMDRQALGVAWLSSMEKDSDRPR